MILEAAKDFATHDAWGDRLRRLAYANAIGLCEDPAMREFLRRQAPAT